MPLVRVSEVSAFIATGIYRDIDVTVRLCRVESNLHDMTYRVLLDGEFIGSVHRARRSRHVKSGRLISRTTSASKWYAERLGVYRRPIERDTRSRALLELVTDWFRENRDK